MLYCYNINQHSSFYLTINLEITMKEQFHTIKFDVYYKCNSQV
ncbi:hypothetical protein ECHWAK_0845 [Ehrlichia chaffeensis str. Wakulla]|nr:hypothetical protein ECHWAK_0845 [Ehrlichia chaffeensis str. Wakulla]